MARARDPNRDKAFEIFKEHNGDITNRKIAEMLGVLEKTISAWKSRDKWNVVLQNGECSTTKQKQQNKPKKKVVAKDETPIIENGNLTDKQQLFCIYYVKLFNATKAYQKAYGVSRETAESISYRLMENDGVRAEIQRLKQHRMNDALFDKYDVLQKYKDIAFADMSEYVGWGYELEPIYDDDGMPLLDDDGNERMYKRSYVYLKNDAEVDSTIVTGVTKGKDGVTIKLGDKMRALDFLAKYTDLLNDNEIKKLRAEEQRMKNIQMERELGGNQHKADPFDSMSVDDLEKHLAGLGDAE